MRADRLPDLVNQTQAGRKGAAEASVTVTFDLLSEFPLAPDGTPANVADAEAIAAIGQGAAEWSVTRRLRVTRSGNYTSTYYINGEVATLTELHEQLSQLRIYPEGYNVVLQGDVTSIISMNLRERREIIDELAGVAGFDRKIDQAKQKFVAVQEREDQCRIVERELVLQRDKLADDRLKAQKYQTLKAEYHEKVTWEKRLIWQQTRSQVERLREQIEAGDRDQQDLTEQLTALATQLEHDRAALTALNAQVKALGEEELITLQTQLAQQTAARDQAQQQCQTWMIAIAAATEQVNQLQAEITQQHAQIQTAQGEQARLMVSLQRQQQDRAAAAGQLERDRQTATALATTADAWMREQMELRHQTEALQAELTPLQADRAQLQERLTQADRQVTELTTRRDQLTVDLASARRQQATIAREQAAAVLDRQRLTEAVQAIEQALQLQQDTQKRLLAEQREKQRQLDKLEAQAQAMQEASGSQATQLILKSGLDGVCGLVAQLGRVEQTYRLALETAAGGRLGQLVVEDDLIAAAGIRLLKEKRAGRATFLPLNKLRSPQIYLPPEIRRSSGFIALALDLIDCDPRYQTVFAYVFGSTVVFDTLTNARSVLGQGRIVTLDGELLETSGAMTGGATTTRNLLRFGELGAAEPQEVRDLRERLAQISTVLDRCEVAIAAESMTLKETARDLQEATQTARDLQRDLERSDRDVTSLQTQLEQTERQRQATEADQVQVSQNLLQIEQILPEKANQLQALQTQLTAMEAEQTHDEWTTLQASIRQQEQALQAIEQALREVEQQYQAAIQQETQLQATIARQQAQIQALEQTQADQRLQCANRRDQLQGMEQQIAQLQTAIAQLNTELLERKTQRDRLEVQTRDRQHTQQETDWQLQKLIEAQEGRRSQLTQLTQQLREQEAELPDPLPELPAALQQTAAIDPQKLEELQKSIRNLARRIEAMEPVNMLALEEFEKTQARLDQLSERLAILEAERTEILLRIENFTTLRVRAFREAFDAVNENFAAIFAELSQGDGYLQLTDPENPFESGLNLVAHPKGKPVQRLASMSGGEKSLTALSFIFALQRYRPSPFYAFDEVDMFLDGANVERLAKMVQKQAKQAQFLVVSLRRPMIEASMRTIGVTQARGAHTQVLGLKLKHGTF